MSTALPRTLVCIPLPRGHLTLQAQDKTNTWRFWSLLYCWLFEYIWIWEGRTFHCQAWYHVWLVVYLPLWKIWLRQLGWWHSQNMESHKFQVPNHQPDVDDNSVLMVIRKVSSISELANPTKPTQFRHANRHGPCQFLGVWSLVSSNKRGIANWGSKNWFPYPYPYHLTIGCLCWGSVYVS